MDSINIVCPQCGSQILRNDTASLGDCTHCPHCGTQQVFSADKSEQTTHQSAGSTPSMRFLVQRILSDQRRRLEQGDGLAAESYFEEQPALLTDPEAALDIICNEMILRREAGDDFSVADYEKRFPQFAAQLRLQFEVEQALQSGSPLDSAFSTRNVEQSHSTGSLSDTGVETVELKPASHQDDTRLTKGCPERAGRYFLLEEIARGGMGAVLRARDPDFDRSLAIKITLRQARQDSAAHGRFLEEARITGRLQHPGIPPVHELGQLDDGRPFFAMKLIEGQTLAALLKNDVSHGGAESARAIESADCSASAAPLHEMLPRFLNIFGQICQTIGYAHSRGVIHRDLKPANIMVGAFGEVQVMDWGLAKQLGSRDEGVGSRDEAEDSNAVLDPYSLSPTPYSLTKTGDIMGTPAFMAPEQARGEIEIVDERSDVFGLGAMLCVMLTGQPPFNGDDAFQIVGKARKGELSPAFSRLGKCGADVELIELAKRCLAPKKEDRFANGGELADAVEQYQTQVQERLRQAELERETAQVQAQEERKRREVEQARTEAERAKAQAERRRRRATMALAASVLVFVVAVSGALVWYLNDLALRREAQARRESLKQARGAQLQKNIQQALAEDEKQRAKLQENLGQSRSARSLLSEPNRWRFSLASASASWRRAKSLADSDPKLVAAPLQTRLQQAKTGLDNAQHDFDFASRLDAIRLEAFIIVDGAIIATGAGPKYLKAFQDAKLDINNDIPEDIGAKIKASPIRYALVEALDHWLEVLLTNQSQNSELIARLMTIACRADPDPWRDRVRDPATRHDAAALKKLAANVDLNNQPPGAMLLFTSCLHMAGVDSMALLRSALDHHPRDFWLSFGLGNKSKDAGESIGCYRTALSIRPNSAIVHYNMGVELQTQGDVDRAIAQYQTSISIDSSFVEAHANLGKAFDDKGNFQAAMKAYGKALAIDPNSAQAHNNLGKTLVENGKVDEGIKHYRLALKQDGQFAMAHNNLANALAEQGKHDEAIQHYNKALKIRPNYATAHGNLAVSLKKKGDLNGAMKHYRKSLQLEPKSAMMNYNLAILLKTKGQVNEALTHLQKTIALDPNHAEAHCNIGFCFRLQGRFAEALPALERGHELGSKQPKWNYPSASWIRLCRRLVDLEKREKRNTIDLKSGSAEIKGKLTADTLDIFPQTAKSYRKAHAVRLKAGVSYQIDLNGDFDTTLRVEDNIFQGLLFNDDVTPPGDLNSRLVFTPAKAGDYRLIVTTYYPGKTGSYTLSINETTPVGDPNIVEGSLSKSDPTVMHKFYKRHEVQLKAGQPCTIEALSKQFDAYLYLLAPSGQMFLARNDDAASENLNARLDFTPQKTGTYAFLVTSAQLGETGDYQFRVQSFNEVK